MPILRIRRPHRALRLAAWALIALAPPAAARAADSAPKHRDSPPFLVPKEVSFTAEVAPARARPGEAVTLTVRARVKPPWHIYAYSPEQPEQGPRSTQFDLFDPAGLTPVGDWTPSRPPTTKPEEAFDNRVYGSYEGEVAWGRRLRVPPDAVPGARSIGVQVYFQICDPNGCRPPVYKTLPKAELTVLADSAAAGSPPAAGPSGRTSAPTPVAEPADDRRAVIGLAAPPPTPGARAADVAPAAASEVELKIGQGLGAFLLFSAVGGLLALAMPCVWPMVPVTVNFFVKQGQSKAGGSTTRLAVTYCLAIIAIFTLVGVLFSAFMGAASLQRLANTAWLNLTVAAIFFAFGLSLLGLFELRLPGFLLNASAQGEGRGGLVGVIFMALTLTITSFTCTFPVVGGLLVLAAGGSYLYPILGLMTFAAVLALPFFLLALAPGLLQKVPRSGDWMNAVKVVGGLVEIGAAFKFLNTAEIALGATPESAWFDAQVVLAAWVVLAAVSGLYLLGLFRTDHDHADLRVGPVRLLSGAVFLFFALYMAPALFGVPPQGHVYNLFVGLLPPDVGELARPAPAAEAAGAGEVRASSTDPERAQRQETKFHGVSWGLSYNQARERARAEGKPVLIDFTGVNCANCRQMEREVMPRAEIRDLLRRFVTVALYTDYVPIGSLTADQREELARANQKLQYELRHDVTTPLYVVLDPDGAVVDARGGYIPAAEYREFLATALARAGAGAKVARAE